MLKFALSEKRLWLTLLIAVFSVVLARWTIEPANGYSLVIHGGYWLTLVMVGLFIRAAYPLVRARWSQAGFGRFELGVVVAIAVIMTSWVSQDKPGYKILADELLLSGTAMGMHYERDAAYPVRATDVQGSFQILANIMDKRPLLFPFLVATVHDLTGYRIENSFYLNIGLGALFLWITYLTGWTITRLRWGGFLAMLLFAGLPLLAQQSTGAGFELLNLLMLAVCGLLLVYFFQQPADELRLEALIYGALLLATTRYESVLFIGVTVLAVGLGWIRSQRIGLSWAVVISPIFLVPVLMQNRVFSDNSQAWQMASLGVTEPFALQYFGANVGHALAYFFDFSGDHTNSPLFAALGLLGLPFFALWIYRVFRKFRTCASTDLAWAVLGLGLFGLTAILMLYFWGRFDDPIISRLSLPVHYLMGVAILVVGAQWCRTELGWQRASLVVLGGIFFYSLPVMARQAYRSLYAPGVEMQIRADFYNELPDRNVLFFDQDSVFWILRKIPASTVKQAEYKKEALAYHLRNHSFQAMYVFQSVLVDDTTGARTIDPLDSLDDDFVLEPVLERRVHTLLFARISRVTAILDKGKVVAEARPFVVPNEQPRTSNELEQARALYMENWIKQLP